MALFFVIPLTIAFALTAPSLLPDRQLFALDVEFTIEFRDTDERRLNDINEALEQVLPRGSRHSVREKDIAGTDEAAQITIIEVSFSTPLAYFTMPSVPWKILDILGHRSPAPVIQWEIVAVSGPPTMLVAFWLHLALIPWLIIRLWWMPRSASPARPVWPQRARARRSLALSVGAGLVIGILVTLVFSAAEVLGLLEFSDNMPTLATFGIDRNTLLLGALLAALVGAVEEVFFRGVLLRRFVQNGLPVFGVIFCAILFTMIHFPAFSWYSGNIAYALLLGLGGLGLGFLTLRTGTWVHAAAAHGVYNLAVLLPTGLVTLAYYG